MTAIHLMTLLACGCVSLSSASTAEPQCYSNKQFHVAMRPYADDAGNQFAVTRLTGEVPSRCRFDAAKADFVIGKNGDPLWYADLAGDKLILSRSTGPQGDLVIYDLKSGKAVLDLPADEYELKGSRLSFWERTGPATAKTCPGYAENEANGLGSVTAALRTFDLEAATVSDAGASKCIAVQ